MQASLPLTSIPYQYVTLDFRGQVTARHSGQCQVFVEDLGGGVTFEMTWLEGGAFRMGAPGGQGYPDEHPQHLVSLPGFFIGRGLVTQAMWQTIMGSLPPVRFHGPDVPLENITWQDAGRFCRRLARKTGRPYHLPYEAQWEYACRAGTQTPFSTGETITTDYANYVGDHVFRDEPHGVYRHAPLPAGTLLPNPWGLYDLHGTLWEFCADAWHPDYSGAPFNGEAWLWGGEPGYCVARGGSWHEPPANCCSSTRLRTLETEHEDYYGFRLAM